jgi:hypothetical protein
MAFNVQRGPNRMDSGDWTRMLRLRGSVGPVSVTPNPPPVPCCTNGTAPKRYPEFGLSRIQKPASAYTDYVAANTLTYYVQRPASPCGANQLVANAICRCEESAVIKHNPVCIKCKHDNRVGPTNT